MENIRNFVNGITGNDSQQKNEGLKTQTVPRVDGNNMKHLSAVMEKPRNRTESESSSASMSSVSSVTSVTNTQKDKDPYFWVM